jgi:hypothetical protein
MEAIDKLKIKEPVPENAQLSRLRGVVRRAWREGRPEVIINHLDGLKAAAEQFERAWIRDQRFSTWLRDGIDKKRSGAIIWKISR